MKSKNEIKKDPPPKTKKQKEIRLEGQRTRVEKIRSETKIRELEEQRMRVENDMGSCG